MPSVEQEVLYMKGTRFKITGVRNRGEDGTMLIEMEEVDDAQEMHATGGASV